MAELLDPVDVRDKAQQLLQESCELLATHCDNARENLLGINRELAGLCTMKLTREEFAFWIKQFRGVCKENAQRYELIAEQLRSTLRSQLEIAEALRDRKGAPE